MMTGDWDFYFCNVNDKPASIYLDLGIAELLPIDTHPVMAYVRVTMNAPRDDGMSSGTEYDQLIAIEDALETLCSGGGVLYVGRCTSDGCRDFYFYLKSGSAWQDPVDQCMRAFPGYQYRQGSREDVAWSTYHSYLYPSDISLQSIQNRRVCAALERNGDALDVAREIDHWAEFELAANRDSFVAEALELGFSVRVLAANVDEGTFSAQLFRVDVPTMHTIDDVTLPLYRLAAEHGGSYDGWESVVVQSEDSTAA